MMVLCKFCGSKRMKHVINVVWGATLGNKIAGALFACVDCGRVSYFTMKELEKP